jgi:hypothetical protein
MEEQMSQRIVSILDPPSAEAVKIILGRRMFLHEIGLACLLSLALPALYLGGALLFLSGVEPVGLAIGTVTCAAVTAIPLLAYASLRLNAATLARERAVQDLPAPDIHAPLQGPALLRSGFAGSVRSRLLSGLPSCIGFGITFAGMSWEATGSLFSPLHLPLGILLVVQARIILGLLR